VLRAAAIAAVLLSACATRDAPYRFRSPMIGGVRAVEPERPERSSPPAPEPRRYAAHATRRINRPELDAGQSPGLADVLRGLVGQRDRDSSHLDFAFQAAAAVGAELDPQVAALDDGPALVALARERSAITTPASALLGDLVVFDRVDRGRRASLIGVIASRRRDGTLEFVYLGRGVVRRGWVNPEHPGTKRGDDGRVLNTFVRHSNGGLPRGTKFLAGELLAEIISLDRLTR
jgi:hypothetical protein